LAEIIRIGKECDGANGTPFCSNREKNTRGINMFRHRATCVVVCAYLGRPVMS